MGFSENRSPKWCVSIPQWCDCCPTTFQLISSEGGFNPTMVRLLQERQSSGVSVKLVSIPQWCDCCLLKFGQMELKQAGFNPTMVRLLRLDYLTKALPIYGFNPTMVRLLLCSPKCRIRYHTVSIPQWCDCCRQRLETIDKPFKFQSHNGAIAAKNEA